MARYGDIGDLGLAEVGLSDDRPSCGKPGFPDVQPHCTTSLLTLLSFYLSTLLDRLDENLFLLIVRLKTKHLLVFL